MKKGFAPLATEEEAEGGKDSASSAGGGAAEEKPLLEQEAEQSEGARTPTGGTAAELEAAVTLLRSTVEALTPRLEQSGVGQDAGPPQTPPRSSLDERAIEQKDEELELLRKQVAQKDEEIAALSPKAPDGVQRWESGALGQPPVQER